MLMVLCNSNSLIDWLGLSQVPEGPQWEEDILSLIILWWSGVIHGEIQRRNTFIAIHNTKTIKLQDINEIKRNVLCYKVNGKT